MFRSQEATTEQLPQGEIFRQNVKLKASLEEMERRLNHQQQPGEPGISGRPVANKDKVRHSDGVMGNTVTRFMTNHNNLNQP